MVEQHNDLGAVLAEVRRRWARGVRLSAWTTGAAAATMLLGVGALTVWLLASEGLALAVVVLLVLAMVAVTLACALWPVRNPPTDLQLARFIEERAGGLDDVVVTAVQHGASGTVPAAAVAMQAVRAVEAVGFERIISSEGLRRAAIGAGAATLVLLAGSAAFAPTVSRGFGVAAAYLLPTRLLIEVSPGTSKVRAGSSLTITARLRGLDTGLVPELHVAEAAEGTGTRMTPAGDGTFTVTLDRLQRSFGYRVTAGPARSDEFAIDVIRPARVTRIDLRYRYPEGLGLEPRVEEDGGDIYGPSGTTVDLTIVTDKPVTTGALAMGDGTRVSLAGQATQLSASLPIRADGAYRVALTDVDGLENPGDTEYFIRMLNDRPPDVRVMRPGGDKQVTPLEEVEIEARAEDDFGVASLELVFQTPGQKDTVVPFPTNRAVSASGRHLIQLESLGVRPGDFVTYHARARDVGQGRRGAETRSDIFFLEVKPFEETFVAAQSQAMGQQGSPQLQELAEAQKEIIAATWKLDARARRAGAKQSATDIKAVAEAQSELRTRAAEQAGDVAAELADPRRRRPRPGQSTLPGGEDPMGRAVEAMGRAAGELDGLKTAEALPHEMEALEQLLKADSDVKRRQIARQQQGGGAGNRQTPDLSTLFDQQLRKQQQTNYETPNDTESRPESTPEDDALAKIRELARRQEALQRAQRELARSRDRMNDEEIKRQLERLTREQQQLAEQANELSKQIQQSSRASSDSQQNQSSPSRGQPSPSQGSQSQSRGSQSQQGGTPQDQPSASSRRLREISEQMRGASSELRRDDPEQASARSGQAAEQLRDLTRQMERARPEERRRAMGELQFETRQVAEAERRLASEAERLAPGAGGEEARRRLAAEQERLAERTDRLRQAARDLSEAPGASGDDADTDGRQAAGQAARDLERERIAERMRSTAEALRRPAEASRQGEQSRELARALDRIAGGMGEAAGTADRETERLSDQLARAGELRDQLGELQRTIEALEQEAREGQQGGRPQSDASGQPGQPSASPSPGQEGATGGQAGGGGGRAERLSRLQREAADRMREAQRLAGELKQASPEMQNGLATPENWYPSLSAPGTEAFKQDFGKWESLKKGMLTALERTETRVSSQLREREARERLNAGGHQGVSSDYQEMVDRYYQSLAAPRKPPR